MGQDVTGRLRFHPWVTITTPVCQAWNDTASGTGLRLRERSSKERKFTDEVLVQLSCQKNWALCVCERVGGREGWGGERERDSQTPP